MAVFVSLAFDAGAFDAPVGAPSLPRRSSSTPLGAGYLVRFQPTDSTVRINALAADADAWVVHRVLDSEPLYFVVPRDHVPPAQVGATIEDLQTSARVEPNQRIALHAPVLPDDTHFHQQWALHDPGDVDINAPEAWALLGTGSSEILVAVIDSGVDCTHRDLEANLWRNPGEIAGNGIDDDGNGYVDDVMGWNALEPGKPPCDETGHGTWVAGVIGAVGNNGDADNGGSSTTGVVWKTGIVPCKFGHTGSGDAKGAIACLKYVAKLREMGHRIVAVNASWGDMASPSAELEEAIARLAELDVLFIASSGQCNANIGGCNLDEEPRYPASYTLPNLITVAAIDSSASLTSLSKFGRRTVHVGAPGDEIVTLHLNNLVNEKGSTSLAAPHVTGIAALLAQQLPEGHSQAIRNLILSGGVPVEGLAQQTITGRRVQAAIVPSTASCSDRVVRARLRPNWKYSIQPVNVGEQIAIQVLHIACAQPAGDVTVEIVRRRDGDTKLLTLEDDGNAWTGDAVYGAKWTVPEAGEFEVRLWKGTGAEDVFLLDAS